MSGLTSKWTAPESAVISFPKCTGAPSQHRSHVHSLHPLSTSNLHVEIKLLMMYLTLCFRGAQEVFLLFFFTLLHVAVSSPDHLLLCPNACVNLNHTNHRRVIIIIAPFLVVPFPAARASCSTNAPLRLPASFLPSSGNNSHESQHDTALG